MRSTLAEFRAHDRRVWLLAGTRLVATWAFSMTLPLMVVHLTQTRGVRPSIVGLIMTAGGLCGAIGHGYAGMLSDRIGRLPLMMGSSLIRTILLGLIGYAVSTEASIPVIAGLMIANGATRAFFDAPSQALVADLVAPEKRVSAFSLQRMGVNIGFTAGPALGALAASLGVPYYRTFYWSVPVSLVAMLSLLTLRNPETVAGSSGVGRTRVGFRQLIKYRHDRVFMAFLAATFAFFILQVQLFTSLPVFAAHDLHLAHPQVLSLFAVNGVLVVLLQIPAAAFINRIGRGKALVLGCLGYAVAYAAVGFSVDHHTLLMCVAAVTVSEVILAPTQHAQVTSMAPAGEIGAYAGLFGLAQIAGQSLGPVVGTTVLDLAPGRMTWFILALFGLLAAYGYRPRKHAGNTPARP